MKKLLIVNFIFLVFSLAIFAQNNVSQVEIRENGWNITLIKQLLEENQKVTHEKVKLNSEKEIDVTYLELKKKVFFELKDFFTDKEISKMGKSITPIIEFAKVFSLKAKIFAYEISFKFKSTSGGRIEWLGTIVRKTFIDKDGDGKFETLDFDLENVPNWVIK